MSAENHKSGKGRKAARRKMWPLLVDREKKAYLDLKGLNKTKFDEELTNFIYLFK